MRFSPIGLKYHLVLDAQATCLAKELSAHTIHPMICASCQAEFTPLPGEPFITCTACRRPCSRRWRPKRPKGRHGAHKFSIYREFSDAEVKQLKILVKVRKNLKAKAKSLSRHQKNSSQESTQNAKTPTDD